MTQMLSWAVTVLTVVACKSDRAQPSAAGSGSGPGSGPGSGTGSASLGSGSGSAAPSSASICKQAAAALDKASCPPELANALRDAKQAFIGVIDTVDKVGSSDSPKFTAMCAQMYVAIERDARKAKCTLELDPTIRADIDRVLEAWFAQRTPIAPTGDRAADAVVEQIGKLRDATCACTDLACLDGLEKQLPNVPKMADGAPQAARDLGSNLLADAVRCATRLRLEAP